MQHPFYADKQYKVWIRIRFFIEADSQEEANQKAIDALSGPSSKLSGKKEEYLHLTLEQLFPEPPFPRPTIELYTHEDELIYDNLLDSINITDIQKT